jgi:FkbM family methyltransferase
MTDYRSSAKGRRQSWYGAKRYVKGFLALRVPHALMRAVLRFAPRIRRSGRLPAPAHLEEVPGRVLDISFVMMRPELDEVAKELYWGGGTRPQPADRYALELFARAARRSDVAIDIGAYTGIFTLVAALANPKLEVHAFEVVPDIYTALVDNCARNDVLHRVTLHHVGLGDPDRIATFPAVSATSALPSYYSSRLSFEDGVRIRFRSLDSFVYEVLPGSRVLMKVDVEGTENEIFTHGQEFLSSLRPDILCEVLHGVADGPELEALLAPHGYRFYRVGEVGLDAADHIEPAASIRDWFFTTREQQDLSIDAR